MQSLPQGSAVSIESLLAHADWVRALARQLVSDPASADDVEQEVWRAAIENPPRDGSNPRGWLASVARNAARTLGRANSRREAREQRNARAEALPATSELVAEAELARELAGEVLALEEPYRTVLLLRFWRALSPEEIAHAQSISRETVRTQLKRGLERLRERLDRRFGDREKWLAAIAPLVKDIPLALGGTASVIAGGVLALALKMGVAATLAATAWWAWPTRVDHANDQVHVNATSNMSAEKLEVAEDVQSTRASATPQGVASSAIKPDTEQARPSSIAGRVIDLEGRPIAGIEFEWRAKDEDQRPHWKGSTLWLRRTSVEIPPTILEVLRTKPAELDKLIAHVGDEPGFREAVLGTTPVRPRVRSSADGSFLTDLSSGEWSLVLPDPHRVVVAERSRAGDPGWVVVVAPCVALSGVVVDEADVPLHEWIFEAVVPLERLGFTRREMEQLSRTTFWPRKDEDGRFRLDQAPIGPGAMLHVGSPGMSGASVHTPNSDDDQMHIVLKRSDAPRLSGLVLDQQGSPAPETEVRLGQDAGVSDAQGRFEFALTYTRNGETLTATKKGYQPGITHAFGHALMNSRSDLVLQLGPPALTIEGQVLDAEGTPVGRCKVGVTDGTIYGTRGCFLEDAMDGRFMGFIETTGEGKFVLGGLMPRSYRLLAWQEGVGQLVYTDPIPAGTRGVVLRTGPEDFVPEVQGRLVTRRGETIPGGHLFIAMPVLQYDGGDSVKLFGEVAADDEGRFTLMHVPRSWSQLYVKGDGIEQSSLPMPDLRRVPIAVVAALEVDVELMVADEAIDTLLFLDASGAAVHAAVSVDGGTSFYDDIHRKEGKFPLITLTDNAVTAVLSQGKTEIRRVPIEIRREKLLKLHF